MSAFTVLYFVGIITLLLFVNETADSSIAAKKEFCADNENEKDNNSKIHNEKW
jgi:hypothetical protein